MKPWSLLLMSCLAFASARAAEPTLTVNVGQPVGKVSPTLYGLMTEEINYSYDGGLYAELVRNRAFLDNPKAPDHWSVVAAEGAKAALELDPSTPLNTAVHTSLRVDVDAASAGHPAGVANDGYWGMPVYSASEYHATIYAKSQHGHIGSLKVALESDDGKTVYASGELSGVSACWQKFDLVLRTAMLQQTSKARLVISSETPGKFWLGFVSLFPPTWNNQPNGFRRDIMQLLVDLKPKFLRFPGGNYLEGNTLDDRFPWARTLGAIEDRPGHMSPWGYRSTDGMGLLEFLLWCEDMGAEPVLAVNAGYSLNGDHIDAGSKLQPFVKEALDEIEYVIGDVNTKWGAQRAIDGHPAPFKLHYVEIGNEDWFDKSLSYDGRFAQLHDAIKAVYPQLKLISSVGNEHPDMLVKSRKPDVVDEHYYSSTAEFVEMAPNHFDRYPRNGTEIFVGEWAAHEDKNVRPWDKGAQALPPTPGIKAALGDAVWMAAMERNSDLISMHCYAPLFVNVNPGGRQWRPDMIGYDALRSYGSPSYYALKMFSTNLGDELLKVASTNTPVQACATRDAKSGQLYLKLVNPTETPASIAIKLDGASKVSSTAKAQTLSGKLDDTNSIDDPERVVPVPSSVQGVGASFQYTVPANGIVVLTLDTTK